MRTAVAVATIAMTMAGCGGGGGDGGGSDGLGADARACLRTAGIMDEPGAASVVLDGAEPVLVTTGGTMIYRANSPADAARIARNAQASEAEGSVGRWLYLASSSDAANVRACLTGRP